MSYAIADVAVVVNSELDNVAVAKVLIPAGSTLLWNDRSIRIQADIAPGHRFTLRAVPAGEWVRQYGQPFARSLGLDAGDAVTPESVRSDDIVIDAAQLKVNTPVLAPWEGERPVFQGFVRRQGPAGVRNWVVVIPMSMCADHEAVRISTLAEQRGIYTREAYPNVDGVTVLSHDGGCACPDFPENQDQPSSLATTLRIFHRHIQHPNVGAVLMVELGCEKSGLRVFQDYFGLEDLSDAYGKPVRMLTIQTSGGSQATIERGLALLPELLTEANATGRSQVPLSELAVGVECGGSDGFSGLSANPALGAASDLWIRAGGSTVIAEVPEFFGAEHLFAQRAVNQEVGREVLAMVQRYRNYAARGGHALGENPSPGNRAGGLINITVKSLGAIAKSGTAPVQGVLDYGERLWGRPERGLYMLNTPGYDQTSVPGLVAAGCQVVCFTTGRGSSIGNAIAPVVKIGSNNDLYRRMAPDIDVNAGAILSGEASQAEIGQKIYETVLAAANGSWTRAELSGHREFAIWDIEGIML